MSEICYHCGLPVPKNTSYSLEILGKNRKLCCAGCEAVAKAIISKNLLGYYKNRTSFPQNPDELIPPSLKKIPLYDKKIIQKSFVRSDNKNHKEASLILEGIVCQACVWLSEQHVQQLDGIVDFTVNLTTERATVTWDDSKIKLSEILQAIADIGYIAHPFNPEQKQQLHQKTHKQLLRKLLVAGLGMMQIMSLSFLIYLGAGDDVQFLKFLKIVLWLVSTPIVFYSATVFFIPAWRDLKNYRLGMDVPIALAIILSYLASVYSVLSEQGDIYFDSVSMLVFFLIIGRLLEQSARHKASLAIESQSTFTPHFYTLKKGNVLKNIPAADIQVDDEIVIAPGEKIPADAVVIDGSSSVNESMLSGESIPVAKTKDDTVLAESINFESPLTIKITKVGTDTMMASILRLLNQAQNSKPRITRLTDKVASWFVSFVLLLAGITFIYWYQDAGSEVIWIVVSVLVVTCPCALSLATPVATTIATSLLSKKGILLIDGQALETFTKVTDIIFDKTGTLTTGHPTITRTEIHNDNLPILTIASSLEAYSKHPLANAFKQKDNLPVQNISVKQGFGISGTIDNINYKIGNAKFINQLLDLKKIKTEPNESCVFLADDNQLLATFYLSDSLRPDALPAIKALQKMNITTHLCSGDNKIITKYIAKQLNITNIKGAMLPDDKLAYLKNLQQQQKIVLMVGDGVNDAPILAGANVSIAINSGNDIAKNAADAILIANRLGDIGRGIQYSKTTLKIIKQNLGWAIVYNALALPLASLGLIVPWMAAVGMSFSSLLVILNSLRLLKK